MLTEDTNLPPHVHFHNCAGHFFAQFSITSTGARFTTHAYQNPFVHGAWVLSHSSENKHMEILLKPMLDTDRKSVS